MPAELETSPQSYALKTVSSSITRLFVGQAILGSATWITMRTTRRCHSCLSKLQRNRNYIRRTLGPPKPWKIRTNCLNKSHGPWTVISGVHYAAFWTNGPNVVANIAAARENLENLLFVHGQWVPDEKWLFFILSFRCFPGFQQSSRSLKMTT